MLIDFINKLNLMKTALTAVEGLSGAPTDRAVARHCSRTPWDKFIEGMKRLIRPMILFGIIGMFVWGAHDPKSFGEFAQAIALIPQMGWYIIYTVVASWAVQRGLQDWRQNGSQTDTSYLTDDTPSASTDESVPPAAARIAEDAHHDLVAMLPAINPSIEAFRNALKPN